MFFSQPTLSISLPEEKIQQISLIEKKIETFTENYKTLKKFKFTKAAEIWMNSNKNIEELNSLSDIYKEIFNGRTGYPAPFWIQPYERDKIIYDMYRLYSNHEIRKNNSNYLDNNRFFSYKIALLYIFSDNGSIALEKKYLMPSTFKDEFTNPLEFKPDNLSVISQIFSLILSDTGLKYFERNILNERIAFSSMIHSWMFKNGLSFILHNKFTEVIEKKGLLNLFISNAFTQESSCQYLTSRINDHLSTAISSLKNINIEESEIVLEELIQQIYEEIETCEDNAEQLDLKCLQLSPKIFALQALRLPISAKKEIEIKEIKEDQIASKKIFVEDLELKDKLLGCIPEDSDIYPEACYNRFVYHVMKEREHGINIFTALNRAKLYLDKLIATQNIDYLNSILVMINDEAWLNVTKGINFDFVLMQLIPLLEKILAVYPTEIADYKLKESCSTLRTNFESLSAPAPLKDKSLTFYSPQLPKKREEVGEVPKIHRSGSF